MLLLGLFIMYTPTYLNLLNTVWQSEDQAHGPLIVGVVLYLVWVQRHQLFKAENNIIGRPVIGGIVLVFGLLLYILGRSQDIAPLDIASQIPVFAGLLLIFRGYSGLRALWFPLFFLIFMVPLPGVFLDAVTLPMKIAVSYVAENILYWIGYPISRSGVILQIGQYQLLVADACAGLHTLISLEALGLLYLNVVKHDSFIRNVILGILIIPISFTANVIRVMVLTLVTYHFGDAAGQGFVHGFAGMLLFVVALILIISVDTLLQYLVKKWQLKA
nr:exosortase B [Methylobacillus flagellatus]